MLAAMRAGSPLGLLALCLLQCVPEVSAAGKSIFKLGSEIDHKHWDVMGMYFMVFGITILFELVVHRLHMTVTSDSGSAIVHHITQEVMILGGISAVLVVFENLGGTSVIDAPLFHYVHFVIFLMAIIFIILVSSLFVTVDKAWAAWSRFEHRVDEIESDPSLDFDSKAAFLQQYLKSHSNGQRMLACLLFFRHSLPGPFADVSFSRYMRKMQRKYMLAFLDLHSTTWALLAVLCAIAAIVTSITLEVSDNELATVGLWVLFVGFGPLLVLVISFFKIRHEYRKFTSEVLHMRRMELSRPRRQQKSFFWQGKPGRTIFLLQIMLLYQVFFLATAAVNFTYRLAVVKPLGPLLIVICFIPSLIVFFVMVPAVLPPFTILASLGDLLDHDTLLRMKVQDKMSGRYRRLEYRDQIIAAPPKYLSTKETVLQNFSTLQQERDAGSISLDYTGQCEECEAKAAVEVCRICGYLCNDCSFNYHKLKSMSQHKKKMLTHAQKVLDAEAAELEEAAAAASSPTHRSGNPLHMQAGYSTPNHFPPPRQSQFAASPTFVPPDYNPYDANAVQLHNVYRTLGADPFTAAYRGQTEGGGHADGGGVPLASPFSPSAQVNPKYNRMVVDALSSGGPGSQPRSGGTGSNSNGLSVTTSSGDRQLVPPPPHPRSSDGGSAYRPSSSGLSRDTSVLSAALDGLQREREQQGRSGRKLNLRRKRGGPDDSLASSGSVSSASNSGTPGMRPMGRGAPLGAPRSVVSGSTPSLSPGGPAAGPASGSSGGSAVTPDSPTHHNGYKKLGVDDI